MGELIDLISTIGLGDKENRSKDILGRVYEYFLSQFASAEGKKGGQFYTPQCVVRLLVEMLAPFAEKIQRLNEQLEYQFAESERLTKVIRESLGSVQYGDQ
jgi:type I restriction enzyme M protein